MEKNVYSGDLFAFRLLIVFCCAGGWPGQNSKKDDEHGDEKDIVEKEIC